MRDYPMAYRYYKTFLEIKKALNLDVYQMENAKIGVVYSKVGLKEQSEKMFDDYLASAEKDKSIYKHLSLAVYYSYQNEPDKAIQHLKQFSQQDNFHYWTILFLKMDPLVDNIKDLPEFKRIYKEMEAKFWKNHRQIKIALKAKGLV